MKQKEWNQGLNHIDYDLIEKYTLQKEKLKGRQHTKSVWLRVGALAACLVLIIGAVIMLPLLQNETPSNVETTPSVELNNIVGPHEKLTGSSEQFVVNSSSGEGESVGSGETIPIVEYWDFIVSPWHFIVKVRVVGTYSDEYYDIQTGGNQSPYRLVKMEVLETLHGENMPQYFLYLIPSSLYVDLSAYDALLISMKQCGTEHYVLKNTTQNQMEAFDCPVFSGYKCDFGCVIAFSDGIFDETLWQNEKWSYGYQFGKRNLDSPQDEKSVVRRGDTEEAVIANIYRKKEKELTEKTWGESYQRIPTLATLNVQSQAAKEALEYVKPFENGVFIQTYQSGCADSTGEFSNVVFRRYINGCPTQEEVIINLITEEVTCSEVRYGKEDISKLMDIAEYLANMAKEYSENIPQPPHLGLGMLPGFHIENAELVCLKLSAWYVKVDEKLYGVIKKMWVYEEPMDYGTARCYDFSYILFDMSEMTIIDMEREDLIKIVGTWNIPVKSYYGLSIMGK